MVLEYAQTKVHEPFFSFKNRPSQSYSRYIRTFFDVKLVLQIRGILLRFGFQFVCEDEKSYCEQEQGARKGWSGI
jgi:hypothetical protein